MITGRGNAPVIPMNQPSVGLMSGVDELDSDALEASRRGAVSPRFRNNRYDTELSLDRTQNGNNLAGLIQLGTSLIDDSTIALGNNSHLNHGLTHTTTMDDPGRMSTQINIDASMDHQ
jgi:hypothetical protein